ncbi:MAG: hypothetical protein ACM3X4_00840 [Ignavibacteriales bacterium]
MRKRFVVLLLAALVLLGMALANRYQLHILVWQANPNIKVQGIKLIMQEDEVVRLMGGTGEHIQGFGGYQLAYRNRGIVLTFLNDRDTDFYKKVNQIRVSSPVGIRDRVASTRIY